VFERYYQTELSYLRDVGRAFAEKNPAVAGMLAERGGDPDVERLIEGFAFVAARLHQRLDNAAPELVEGLIELLLPHFLRPTPACTIVEFRPPAGGLRGIQRIPSGTRLATRAVRGARCSFRTSRPLDLLPLRLTGQVLDDSSLSRPELRLSFAADPGTMPQLLERGSIRLHLHGELPTTTQLYLWCARYLSGVTLRAEDGSSVELGPQALRCVGFDPQDTLFDWPTFSPNGTRLLVEYLTLASKFLFVDVTGLERAAHVSGERFELIFRFARPPLLPTRLPDDTVRLHCVPATNLFDVSAEPVRTTMESRPVLLRASGLDPLHAEVFAVSSVVAVSSARPQRKTYAPFHSFRHALPEARHGGAYRLTRELSPIDSGIHTYIQLEESDPTLLDDQTLSIELTCTNRALPNELQVGDVCVSTPDIPPGVSFSNIGLVSPPTRPPLGTELAWHFVAHLAATRRSLADRDVLVGILSLYNFQDRAELVQGRVHRTRIESLRSATARTTTRVTRGAAVMGTLYRVEAEQSGFASEGDAYIFGAILHGFLSNHAELNSFADLLLVLLPSNTSFRYSAELGA
jgi:type VI secretion system protein ImpG